MIKSKFVALVAASTLALTPGLVACGGQQQASTDDQAKTEETTTEPAATEDAATKDAATEVLESLGDFTWGAEGTTDDGTFAVLYAESRTEALEPESAMLVIKDIESGIAISFNGKLTEADGTSTITDDESGMAISFTTPDANPETGEIKMTIDERGGATLTMADDVNTVVEDIHDAIVDSELKSAELANEEAE